MEATKPKPTTSNTLVNRLSAYCRKKRKLFDISLADKQALGKIVVSKYLRDGPRPIVRVEVKEPEGTFQVLLYPPYFIPVIDALITQYFRDKLKSSHGRSI